MASNYGEFLNEEAISDLSDKILDLAEKIKQFVIGDSSPVEVVTTTGTLLNCGRLMIDHYVNLMHKMPEDSKSPIGFTGG